jgi:hypothetical protein
MPKAPIVTAEEVFEVSKGIRWVALTTDRGDALLNEMRPGVKSYSSPQFDDEFITLGPLTLLGVAEKYSEYLKRVDSVIVRYERVDCVYARLGSQILSVSIEKNVEQLSVLLAWLEKKQSQLQSN